MASQNLIGWKAIRKKIYDRTGQLCSQRLAEKIRDMATDDLSADELREIEELICRTGILDGDLVDDRIGEFFLMM